MPAGPSSRWTRAQTQGVLAALVSGFVLGLPPVFGRQAILEGTAPLTVVMLRTVLGMATLWLAYLLFWRRYLYIYPAGLLGCTLAGLFNGVGSLMFYSGLGRMNASLVQLIFMLYTLFLTLLSWLDGYRPSRFSLFRLGLALAAVYLLAGTGNAPPDWPAALMVLGSGFMYAVHVAINQRVLYDMPSPTVAVYTLSAMALTVGLAYLAGGRPALPGSAAAWQFVLLLTAVTIVSRLALFMGVKYLGGVQASLLGLGETLVTLVMAMLLLNEQLTPVQWIGAVLLAGSLLLIVREQALGEIPRPKPWLQVLAAWSARRALRAASGLPPKANGSGEHPAAE